MENEGQMDLVHPELNQLDVIRTAEAIALRIKEGQVDPLQVLAAFKQVEKIQEKIKETLRTAAVSEMSKYGEKEVTKYGMTFEPMEAGVSYDYSVCNDPELTQLQEVLAKYQAKLKTRQTFLRALKEPVEIVDEDTGEITKLYPPVKTSTSTVKCVIN